ncbi:helicase-related protein [Cohnella yongneupensis]|uniref:Helicase-related protein n=1 Tax=Cohnella yongneupensis TaxID=425006 RepID=A0ABW0QWS2_9BACL
MRAVLYAVRFEGREQYRWAIHYSIAWEVDAHYWLSGMWRVEEGRGQGGDEERRGEKARRQGKTEVQREEEARRQSGREEQIVRLVELLPLGIAEQACERLKMRSTGVELSVQEMWDELCMAAKEVWDAENRGEIASNGYYAESCSFTAVVVTTLDERYGQGERRRIAELAREVGARLSGRALLEGEALQLLAAAPGGADPAACFAALQLAMLSGAVRLVAAVAPTGAAEPRRRWGGWLLRKRRSAALQCRRCGSGIKHLRRTPCAACGGHACAYCEACLTMGRSRACGLLVIGAARGDVAAAPSPAPAAGASLPGRWSLSLAQREAAAAALRFLMGERGPARKPAAFLLWAVTGAGKTEMIFPLLDAVLSRGGRALVATPRRDVVLELAPRLAAAFPEHSRAVLYGGSVDRWENSALTLATTHQLIRFQEAFDLVLIDEMDAFPYRDDRMLQFAAAKCCRESGKTLYLSATPPPDMQREVARRRLACARVPVRFHGHPLPVPRRIALPPLSRWFRNGKLPSPMLKALRQSVLRGAQAFVFVPMIRHVEPLVRLLRQTAIALGIEHAAQIDGTSSKDSLRADKVSGFRDRAIRVLVTTTILERGVTIPKSDVFVLDADAPLFDAASLVQMAGRAGRAAADPGGSVLFVSRHLSGSQRSAIRQIRAMNRLAARQGYLKPSIHQSSFRYSSPPEETQSHEFAE